MQVGEFDPRTQQLLHVTRYNLAVEGGKKDNNGKAILDIELNQHPLGTKIAKLFLLPVQGWTSYSDDQIKAKGAPVLFMSSKSRANIRAAQELIDSHGPYDLFHNNCQKWAVLLFNAICDVKGSRRMRYEAELKNED